MATLRQPEGVGVGIPGLPRDRTARVPDFCRRLMSRGQSCPHVSPFFARLGPAASFTEPLEVPADGFASQAQRHDVVGDHREPESTSPANRLLAEYPVPQCLVLGVIAAMLACETATGRRGLAAVNGARLEVRTAGAAGAARRLRHQRQSVVITFV